MVPPLPAVSASKAARSGSGTWSRVTGGVRAMTHLIGCSLPDAAVQMAGIIPTPGGHGKWLAHGQGRAALCWPNVGERQHDVPVATQTRLSFDVILPLWGHRGPR